MKKLWIIPLLLFYFLSVSGIRVSARYCCGSLAGVSVDLAKDPCGMPVKKNCCSDFCHLFAPRGAQQVCTLKTLRAPVPPAAEPGETFFSLNPPSYFGPAPSVPPPPLYARVPLYLFHGRFVI